MYKSNINTTSSVQIAEVTTRLWIPINTNGKVECRNRNPNVSLTRRKNPTTWDVAATKGQYIECTGKFTP